MHGVPRSYPRCGTVTVYSPEVIPPRNAPRNRTCVEQELTSGKSSEAVVLKSCLQLILSEIKFVNLYFFLQFL